MQNQDQHMNGATSYVVDRIRSQVIVQGVDGIKGLSVPMMTVFVNGFCAYDFEINFEINLHILDNIHLLILCSFSCVEPEPGI